jgi:hypothetical protein
MMTGSRSRRRSARLLEEWACRSGHVEADLGHRLLEELAVLGLGDRLGVGADQLDAVALEHAGSCQRHGEVERGLAAEGRQQGVGPLAAMIFSTTSGQRLDVGASANSGSVMIVAGLS